MTQNIPFSIKFISANISFLYWRWRTFGFSRSFESMIKRVIGNKEEPFYHLGVASFDFYATKPQKSIFEVLFSFSFSFYSFLIQITFHEI